jgi:hypothetical protein
MEKRAAVILSLAVLAFMLVLMNGYATFTGMLTASDLPAPPAPPGMEGSQQVQPSCTENWDCGSWSNCYNGQQTRTCTDKNNCGTSVSKPGTLRACAATGSSGTSEVGQILSQAPSTTSASSIEARLEAIEFKLKALDSLVLLEQRVNDAEAMARNVGEFDSRISSLESSVQALQNELRRLPQQQSPFNAQELQDGIKWNTILSVSLSVFILLIICGYFASLIIQRKHETEESKRLLKQYLINYQKQGYRLETLKMHLKASGWSDDIISEVMSGLPSKPL